MTELTLPFDEAPIRNELEEKYRLWKEDNPGVFKLFEHFAMQMLQQGKRFGIGMLAERVRWEVRTTWAPDQDGFKMNNNHRAYIARDLIAKYPALADLLETRVVKGEEV
jgi:hypothetical protein